MNNRTPSPSPSPLVRAADGSRWREAGTSDTGEQLYVLDGVDPATCARWVKAGEAELIDLVGTLTPVVDLRKGASK
ncbi:MULTISPECIES: hypothetical protein [unclassified Streptomyces]|uniref:hypothetical protein n=1 Tax=unclassified Streptomyces TaxID=2593676 RepID=UPI0036E1B3CC